MKPVSLERHLPKKKVAVGEFRIPKFKILYHFEASDIIKELGPALPFDGNGNANLTGVTDALPKGLLYVSKIYHKCFVKVNEEGTEAAAATSALGSYGCSREKRIDFVADHPFLFMIREDVTGVVLFAGLPLNPLEE